MLCETLCATVQTDRETLILSVDTTTDVRSVAVVAGTHARAQVAGSLRGAQSANLLGDVDTALKEAGVRLKEIDLFAVATGPGSFTGLRAGLATIKAFAAALDKPAIGVPTLHTIARAAGQSGHVLATLPAGRGELFAQLLEVAPDGAVAELNEPAHVPPAVLVERALQWARPLTWAGAGAHAHVELLKQTAAQTGLALQAESDKDMVQDFTAPDFTDKDLTAAETHKGDWLLVAPPGALAVFVAELALRAYQSGGPNGVAELRALYVRLSDAELNERCHV
jgi:tRNA threonylcarbamoyladenosine biosynthesis protein TsaB